MAGMLHNLENNEAILLMYLADELPAEDRAEVEQQLASDAGLRTLLEQMTEAWAACGGALETADAVGSQPLPVGAATRRASRLVRQWATERLARPAPVVDAHRLPFPWWSYPLASAACVLIGFLALWGLNLIPRSLNSGSGSTGSPSGTVAVVPPTTVRFSDLPPDQQQELAVLVSPDETNGEPTTMPDSEQPPAPLPTVGDSKPATLDAIEAALVSAQSGDEVDNILADVGGGSANANTDGQGTP